MGWVFNSVDNVPTSGPQITVASIILTVLSLATVLLRLYVRFFLIKAPGADDALVTVSWVGAAGFAVITIIQTKWGLGLEKPEDLPLEDVYNFGLIQYMGAPFYIIGILSFKLSLLLSYLRLFPKHGAWFHVTVGVIVACILFHLSFLMVQINLCQPIAKQWDPSITEGSCIPGVPFYTSMASLTILFDVIVMLIPFPILVRSQIQKRKKVVLLGLFGLGVFITIIQIIRIQTVARLANYTDSAPLILWSVIESNLGIIVTNVPTLAPLIKYFNERTRSGRSGYNNSAKAGSKYALQSWKGGSSKVGAPRPLRGVESEGYEGRVSKGDSTEYILETGITKRTEVTVTTMRG